MRKDARQTGEANSQVNQSWRFEIHPRSTLLRRYLERQQITAVRPRAGRIGDPRWYEGHIESW